jgi:hypothetical protein
MDVSFNAIGFRDGQGTPLVDAPPEGSSFPIRTWTMTQLLPRGRRRGGWCSPLCQPDSSSVWAGRLRSCVRVDRSSLPDPGE